MKSSLLLFLALFSLSGAHAGNAVNDACKRLCETDGDCVRKCVAHAELMELKADVIHVAAGFHKSVDMRLTALRTGASIETFETCGKSGWSTDNMLTCLRAYPTPELMKSCKKLSPREEDQVKCLRNGKTSAEVEACMKILVSTDLRLQCVGLQLEAKVTETCDLKGQGSRDRLRCLERAPRSASDAHPRRQPASVPARD